MPLKGPDDEKDEHPECKVHMGFRGQYYGTVTEFRNDGDVPEALAAEEGSIEGMVLETALFQKVRRCMCVRTERLLWRYLGQPNPTSDPNPPLI